MNTTTPRKHPMTVAARVAGEDIQHGDYVTVLNEIVELPSFLWDHPASTLAADELVRLVYKNCDAGLPSKVVAVCLPFVYARKVKGGMAIFDTRRHQLVRLAPETGRLVWKRMRKKSKKKQK